MKFVRCGHAGAGQTDWFLRSQRYFHHGETEGWFTDDTAKRFEAYHGM